MKGFGARLMIYQLSCRITGACVGGSLIKIWACVCKMIFSLPLSLALSTKRSLSKLLILLALCLIMKFRLFWLQEWPPSLSEKRLSSAVVAVTTSHLHFTTIAAKIIRPYDNTVVSPCVVGVSLSSVVVVSFLVPFVFCFFNLMLGRNQF